MKTAIVYESLTGNTKLLADTIAAHLGGADYIGAPTEEAAQADTLYIGFWTDKGSCTPSLAKFLGTLQNKNIFLFGTAGFGGDSAYFEQILARVKENILESNTITGTYMCQGKMPTSVSTRYEKIAQDPAQAEKMAMMIENYERALSHPNDEDLDALRKML